MTENSGNARPVMPVQFFNLLPFDPHMEGNHKHHCPVCEDGFLLMHRNSETGELIANDICTSCGQRVVYTDIDRVRKERP